MLEAAKKLGEAALLLDAVNPFVAIIAGVIRGLVAEARKQGIDPGPFEAVAASVEKHADNIIANDDAYRQRHPNA